MKTDEKEYGTGDNPNPLDVAADVPRQPDWQEAFLNRREKQIEEQPWYPRAVAAPPTEVPERFRAFTVDRSDFQANISPQKWDCTAPIAVPWNDGNHGNPIEVTPFFPGRVSLTVINNGANAIIVSPTIEKALAGIGISVPANGGSFVLDCQGGVWAWAVGGPSTVQAMWTIYESPTTHLPPRGNDW